MHLTPGVKCKDHNCHNCSHYDDFDDFYNYIVGTSGHTLVSRSGHTLVSNHKCDFKHGVVPGWNEQVKELHSAACDFYWLWRETGKPRQGDVFNVMKLSRIKFQHAIRKCKRDKENILADSTAQKVCKKVHGKFWKEISTIRTVK